MASGDGLFRSVLLEGEEKDQSVADPSALQPGVSNTADITLSGHNSTRLDDYNKEEVEEAEDSSDLAASRSFGRDNFEPIHPNDGAVLAELAGRTSRSKSFHSQRRGSLASGDQSRLERADTIAFLELDDPVLDPQTDKFDLNKWIRMTLRLLDQGGFKLARAGICWKNLNVSGKGAALQTQGTVDSLLTSPLRIGELFRRKTSKQILRNFDGVVNKGELLIVLGRPGSGCTTLLKSLTGESYGLHNGDTTEISYNGIPQKRMVKEFKGEVIYNQEVDKHFPHLTVGETLEHAAALRAPSHQPTNISRNAFVKHLTEVVMAVYGLTHTRNTKVGNDFVRGVSGGERKRVSIAETALAGAIIIAWDNSTRGLDSATALTFTKSLRQTANLAGSCHAVAIYQASQAIYDLFDKAVVLYEGRQIFFGRAEKAKAYFEEMGWYCPPRQTTGDFLTSVTNPVERQVKEGFEGKVPRTPDEFEDYWRNSPEFAQLQREIEDHEKEYPLDNSDQLQSMQDMKSHQRMKHARPQSSYVASFGMQIRLNTRRAWQRIWNDKPSTLTPLIGNIIMALIIGSVYFGQPTATANFQSKGAVLFYAILLNALTAISEINSLYSQRPIVEKHKSYAFYHPSTEAIAGIFLDIPLKFAQAVAFNIILYFMAGLRREAGQFFLFFLINFVATFVMSAVFRTVAAITKTVEQAMSLAGVLVLAIVIYTGFVVPVRYMGAWFGWIRWINPIFYSFEILIANEFHGQNFTCSQFVPTYSPMVGSSFVCASTGAVAGHLTVNGDRYIAESYNYYYSHVWRNFGILLGFLFGFMAMYFAAVELNSNTSSAAEVLVFRRGHVPAYLKNIDKAKANDEEIGTAEKSATAERAEEENDAANVIPPQSDVFTWRDVNYDIEIKGEPRRLLDHISGWVKPGTLTALMGTSGAGKTTLLDVLAQRTSTGVVTGSMFVNGAPLDSSFQRKTGYVQQQDLHLETATVRESLRFSALLRQPKSVSTEEKYKYVEDVIEMLNMKDFAEAVVGVPGQGLNVEQRKLLTIGVELAAKPKLLLFLDEPTSGLDSQSSWAICAFLRKLADAGQAVLCTIHQPSAILFQQFDRLLFLRKGGQTVYFGDIGSNSQKLLHYFEANGARHCDEQENPAEYMLEIAADEKWVGIWNESKEAKDVQTEIDSIHKREEHKATDDDNDPWAHREFAMPFTAQLAAVTYRVFQQYWRIPSYIMAKMMLSAASGIFIGFSFYHANTSQQGMQNVIYGIFMVTTIFSTLVQQIMPLFVTQRSLYEVRERPSKAYSWRAFLISNVVVEIPYQIIAGVIVWCTFYYPIVGANQSGERQGLVLLFCIAFFIFASTFAHLCIAALPDAQTAGSVVTLLFSMTLIFNGVFQSATALPGFWIFMYRVSPLTYWVSGMASTMLHGRRVICSDSELSVFDPPAGETCGSYLQPFLEQNAGVLQNPGASSRCGYCSFRVADQFLAGANIFYSERWRNFGLMWAYICFDIAVAVLLYYFFRVYPIQRKSKSKTRAKKAVEPKPVLETSEPSEEEEENPISRQESRPQMAYRTATQTGATVWDSVLTRNLQRVQTNSRNAHVF